MNGADAHGFDSNGAFARKEKGLLTPARRPAR